MKRYTTILVFAFIAQLLGSADPDSGFTAKQPFLITSAGQGADILMVKILAEKAELQFTMEKLARAENLKDQATLIFVSGGSTKGLGAAKIDRDIELARIQALIDSAGKADIKIITMHMGGKARRGKLSDPFNKLAAENADCLIVVAGGDEDQFFSSIAAEKKIPIFIVEKIIGVRDILEGIFK